MPVHLGTDLEADTPELDVDAEKPALAILQVEFTRDQIGLLRQAVGRDLGMLEFVKAAALEVAGREIKKQSKPSDTLHAAD